MSTDPDRISRRPFLPVDLPLITIPPYTRHTHTVVFLHGRGDSAKDFASSLTYSTDATNRSLPQLFPSFRWVFPQAEIQAPSGRPSDRVAQWFDVRNFRDPSEDEDSQRPGLRSSVDRIRRIIVGEVTALGGRWDHLIIAGLSQGGATGVHTLLNLAVPPSAQAGPRRIGAYLGFSTRMPFPSRSLAETRQLLSLDNAPEDDEVVLNTPILLEHCNDDPIFPVDMGRTLRDTLVGFGCQVTWKEYENGRHWFNSPAGIGDAVEFINKHVPDARNA